jgi:NAD(P)-dependent dehydrogenase (short-subunit alcohol dehydrogenase family)
MSLGLEGKRIVITGGSGALGSAVVALFADAGAACEVTWLSDAEQKHLAPRDRVRYHRIDVTDEAAVTHFYASFGDLWASVHLVGGFAMAPLADTTADDFRRMFTLNALSCFLCCREATKAIRRSSAGSSSAGGAGGRIVNTAARPALAPAGGMIAYSASKAAVASITQSLADELKPELILVNAVVPSTMDTPANRRSMPKADFDKWPKVEQVARTVAFLASPDNALTSGALVPVYGQAELVRC